MTKIDSQYGGVYYGLSRIEFADGTVWDNNTFVAKTITRGGAGDDTVDGAGSINGIYSENETFYMGGGRDVVKAGTGNDTIYGEGGNDSLYGQDGNDTLIGGAGSDYMEGGNGVDKYVVNAADGNDTIVNYDTNQTNKLQDKVVFGEGISPEDIELRRWGNALSIVNTKTGQVTKIDSQYGGVYYGLSRIEFADGTVWDNDTFVRKTITRGTVGDDKVDGAGSINGIYSENETFYMGNGNDVVKAGTGNDTIYGEGGNDSLYGQDGNDTLIGGAGSDYMEGGNGVDKYLIGAADGNDTICNYDISGNNKNDKLVFGAGILAADLNLARSGNDMLISNSRSGQVTTIKDSYYSNQYKLYNLEFDDESTGVIDYENIALNITYKEVVAEAENRTTNESMQSDNAVQAIPTEMTMQAGQTIQTQTEPIVQVDSTAQIEPVIQSSTEPVVQSSLTVQTEPVAESSPTEQTESEVQIGQASMAEQLSSAEMIENSVQILDAYMNGEITASEAEQPDSLSEHAAGNSAADLYATDSTDVITMTDLLIQEMNAAPVDTVSDGDVIAEPDTAESALQLWTA